MRVAVTGATGNVGTSVLAALAGDPAVTSIVGIARRAATLALPKVEWRSADVVSDDLVPLFRGADAVVHLTWIVQPNHREADLRAVNVGGSQRVHHAVAAAGVPTLVNASAFGAYAAGAGDRPVDESWPTDGIASSWYSRQKAEVERSLDAFAQRHPEVRLVRFRSALILKREAGARLTASTVGPSCPERWCARAGSRPSRMCRVPASRPSTRPTWATPTGGRWSATCGAPSTWPPSRSSPPRQSRPPSGAEGCRCRRP